MEVIKIYDTTLRDGMQAEGVSFSLEDKLAIAEALDDLGVAYIEGGYAASNDKEMQFFQRVPELGLKHAKVAAFGNTRRCDSKVEDDLSIRSMLASNTPVATLVGKASEMHVTQVLGCSLDDNLKICAESIAYMKQKGIEVIFDAEHFFDGYKADPQYALKVLEAVAEAKGDVLVLCDTNGGCLPDEVYEITRAVCGHLPNVEVGVHMHNDTDCAVANSLAGVRAGARQVQGTINGIGERCGNANLCSIIANLSLKMGYAALTSQKIQCLTDISRFVFEIGNLSPVMCMPYVGDSAFAHKAGLHVNALRKAKGSYEHIDPETVGNERRFLISELSGKSNVLAALEKIQVAQDEVLTKNVLRRVQDLENKGYQFEAADASFDLLVKKEMGTFTPSFHLIKYHVNVEERETGQTVTEATVKLRVGDEIEHVVGEGDGPVNALDAALRKSLVKFFPNIETMHLFDYKVRVVNAKEGTAARVRVIIESRDKESTWGTVGVSENIIQASWLALVDSVEYKLNKDAKS